MTTVGPASPWPARIAASRTEPTRASARAAATSSRPMRQRAPTRTPAPTAEAERRLVTVLFTDLVGFTTIAEDRDPEAVRELLSTYFDTATRIVEVHGGIVEKFIGDAVMAVWGTPIAHEDDAERAVRAGLELVDAVKALHPDLQARAGVLTGEAAVTLGATNQGMVAGDLVNTAARLQGVAEAGHRPRRRGDSTCRRASNRVRAARRPLAEGQDRAGAGLARAAGRGQPWRGGPSGRPRAAIRRARGGAARAEGRPPCGRPGPAGAAGVGHRTGRHRQEPARLGAGEVRRRRRRGHLLASRPLAVLRGGDRPLGARRDGAAPMRPDRGCRRAHNPRRRRCHARRVRARSERARAHRSGAADAARCRGGSRRRTRRALPRLAPLLRAHRGFRDDRAGVRGPPVGGLRAHGLHRASARLVARAADPRRHPRPSRAVRPPSGLGREPPSPDRAGARAADGRRGARPARGPRPRAAGRCAGRDRRARRGHAALRRRGRARAARPMAGSSGAATCTSRSATCRRSPSRSPCAR